MSVLFLFLANLALSPKYYTNTNYVYDLAGVDSFLYWATNGGILRYAYPDGGIAVLTNTEGLKQNRQNRVGIDSSRYIWVGSDLGLCQVDPGFSSVNHYPGNLPSSRVQDIYCLRDTLLVGTSGGFVMVVLSGTPADFNDDLIFERFDYDGLPSNNVLSIAADNRAIWVGTDEGLARFTKDYNPDSTKQYYQSSGLLSDRINKVVVSGGAVYVATDLGLNRFTGDYFDTLVINYAINDVCPIGDSLFLALDAQNQVGIYHQGSFTIAKNGLPSLCTVLGLAGLNGVLFCGLGNRYTGDYYGEGMGRYDYGSQSWSLVKNPCLPSNHIDNITANEYGVFCACGARSSASRGFGWLKDDDTWTNFMSDSLMPSNHVHRCVTAPDKKVWFGLNAVSNTGKDTILVFSYDPANEAWSFIRVGYKGMENTVAIWDIKFDYENNMYLSVAGPSDKLWVLDSALNMVYALDPFQPGFFTEIAIDSAGRIWRTMVAAGLIMTDTKNTLFDRSDDDFHNYTTSDGLPSNYTTGCIIDGQGMLYVATVDGLVRYDGQSFTSIAGIPDNDLFDVALDSEGRIWSLGREGLYLYDPLQDVVQAWSFSGLNSDIDFLAVSTEIIQVQGFEFDPIRGCFWVGGETGLLKLSLECDTPTQLDSILIYPNPVVNTDILRIKKIPLDSRVSIYSIAGRRLASDLSPDPVFGEVVWRIPADAGSGLYFALVRSAQGKRVCKFAIVR